MISQGVEKIDDRYILEAGESMIGRKGERKPRMFFRAGLLLGSAAAIAVICILVWGILTAVSPGKGGAVRVYARETEEEITAAGVVLSCGSISDTGEMRGQPLMFYLTGEEIASVRFSCKNQLLNFMDWTEQRDEYGNAQNFTVPYGENEEEYYYLTVNWVPNGIIRELKDHKDSTIATLPEEMRSDKIVLEIQFENGDTATKAITVSLQEDGRFYAVLQDYRIRQEDSFVRRPDSEAIPREILYAQGDGAADHAGETASGSSADAPPMVCVDGRLYRRSTDQKDPYGGPEDEFVYLGEIRCDITAGAGVLDGSGESASDGVPKEHLQANHPIVGAEVYQFGEDMMLRIQGECWLYERIREEPTDGQEELADKQEEPTDRQEELSDKQEELSEEEKMLLDPSNQKGR